MDDCLDFTSDATTSGKPNHLLALRPIDLQRSMALAIEPKLQGAQNQLGLAFASLGSIERAIAAGATGYKDDSQVCQSGVVGRVR